MIGKASSSSSPAIFRVPTTDPFHYPYGILTKTQGSPPDDGFELHFLDTGVKAAWIDHVWALRETGEFEWVCMTTMNFWDDETGAPIGGALTTWDDES